MSIPAAGSVARDCAERRLGRLCFALRALVLTLCFLAPNQAGFPAVIAFSNAHPLNRTANSDSGADGSATLVTDAQGVWVAVWNTSGGTLGSDTDILSARSTDNGTTWTAPLGLNHFATNDTSADAFVDLATDRLGTWIAVWASENPLNNTIGTDQDILFTKSTDNATTWTAAQALATNAATDGSAFDQSPQIATDRQGVWIAIWSSTNPIAGGLSSDFDIHFTRSTNNGANWSPVAILNSTAPTDGLSPDTRSQLATDGNGNWVAIWQASFVANSGEEDILYSRSTDGGMSWSPVAALSPNAASDNVLEQTPQIQTNRRGTWIAAWQSGISDQEVIFRRSTDAGATWSAAAPLNADFATESANDSIVKIESEGNGHWMAAWGVDASPFTDSDLLFAQSFDDGITWTPPRFLNSNNASTSVFNTAVSLATDAKGNWMAAWGSNDPRGLPGFADFDILTALFYQENAAFPLWRRYR